MIYETFLFTRNQKRDFTAFVRPKDLTNREISIIASALSNITNIADLSPEWPALYSLPVGQYILLLRHYDSGRTHAGRSIGVVEGIAVKQAHLPQYRALLPHFLAHQADVLAVTVAVDDIETLIVEQSAEHDWPDVDAEALQTPANDGLIDAFVARLQDDRLFLPFTLGGRHLLLSVLADPRLNTAYFAFGTNAQALSRLSQAEINVDMVSYFNTVRPGLRNRVTNALTSDLAEFEDSWPAPPDEQVEIETDPDYPTEILPDPRLVREVAQRRRARPEDDPLRQYDAGDEATLTPREMRQRERERQMAEAGETVSAKSGSWLARLIGRLLGHS